MLFLALFLAAVAPACGGDDAGSGDADDGDADDGDADDGDADDGDADDGDADDGDADDGDDGGSDFACKHLDLLFTVDPSGSMTEEMEAMGSEIFPAFASALLDISMGLDDYQVGTVDACPVPATLHTRGQGGECNFTSGEPWILGTPEREPADVTGEFSCVGNMWIEPGMSHTCNTENDQDEQVMSASIAALTPPFVDQENAGFLRDDAVLVVIAVTDEDEELISGRATAEDFYNDLVAIKGDVKDMVFLGIGGGVPDGCQDDPGGSYGTALPAQMLYDVTNLFIAQERGVWWDLCQGELQDGLAEALEVIEQACDDFGGVD
ncbi:MAG TPA: hypothetical protein VNO33_02990 [Kofleriaceae bacterium]|nr:hypothetical protein [Kofleriaceae bacterium]